jgi:predicted dehydrogenase
MPVRGVRGANDDVRVAILGVRKKGKQHIIHFGRVKGVRVVAVCDPDAKVLAEMAELARQSNKGRAVKAVADMREIFEDPDIDAVVIATPNHWHALAAIWACEAGKDVYVEKPVSYDIFESQQEIKAARKHGRIVQSGMQRRSDAAIQNAFERIQKGEFGAVKHVRVINYRYLESIGYVDRPQPAPGHIDYNLWCGPAPMSPLRRKTFHLDWHWFWETGNGEIGNNCPHHLDMARWVLGQDKMAPAVVSLGGRFGWRDNGQTPNTHLVYYDYQPAPIICEIRALGAAKGVKTEDAFMGQRMSVVIQCEHAYFAGLNGGAFYDNSGKRIETVDGDAGRLHPSNFIESVRSRDREDLTCEIEDGHASCGLCHQGNISHRLGAGMTAGEARESIASNPLLVDACDRMTAHLEANEIDLGAKGITVGPMLGFDVDAERFVGPHAEQANRYLRRTYRSGFEVKEV